MKITCLKDNLVNGVSIVSKAVPGKTTMPILECILIEASNGIIKFISNDMEMGIETIIDGEIEENGIIALNAKFFGDMVRRLPDGFVTIQTDSSMQTTITCSHTKFNLPGKSGDDFPYLPAFDRTDSISISQYALKELVRQTIFSISDNDNNKIMTGEYFEINEDHLRAVALDGHRISIRNIDLDQSYDPKKVIVPGKTLSEVSKILPGDTDKKVNIFFMDNNIIFEFDNTTVISRLIEGKFFDIDQMITDNYASKVKIKKSDFLNSIERATLLIKEGDKKPVVFNITEGNIELKINSSLGSLDENLEIEKSGNDVMIGFNPKFLIDVLRVIEEDEISVYLLDSKAPCFIRDDAHKYIYIVLPVNFNVA